MKNRTMRWIGLLLLAWTLVGCSKAPFEVNRITYLCCSGDQPYAELYVFTPDYRMKRYCIQTRNNRPYDLLAGELPSEEEYTVREREISEEDWDTLVTVLSENDAMRLPEEIRCRGQAYDAPSYYVKIETTETAHSTGGYNAGGETDRIHKRFRNIQNVLEAVIQKSEQANG